MRVYVMVGRRVVGIVAVLVGFSWERLGVKIMSKFGSVTMSISFDYDLDSYADGNEWEREALLDMVKDVFLNDVHSVADFSYVDAKSIMVVKK